MKNQKKEESKVMKKFKRHFLIYLRNKHPAYITDEANNNFIFHKVSHSKRISGKNTFKIDDNPIVGDYRPMYISKNRQQDKKNRFSKEKLKTKKGVDISYPFIDKK